MKSRHHTSSAAHQGRRATTATSHPEFDGRAYGHRSFDVKPSSATHSGPPGIVGSGSLNTVQTSGSEATLQPAVASGFQSPFTRGLGSFRDFERHRRATLGPGTPHPSPEQSTTPANACCPSEPRTHGGLSSPVVERLPRLPTRDPGSRLLTRGCPPGDFTVT